MPATTEIMFITQWPLSNPTTQPLPPLGPLSQNRHFFLVSAILGRLVSCLSKGREHSHICFPGTESRACLVMDTQEFDG